MCHSVKTVENVYCITEKKAASAITALFLRNIMRARMEEEKEETKHEGDINDEDHKLRYLFHDFVEKGASPSMKQVKERLVRDSVYREKNRIVYDKVRFGFGANNRKKSNHPNSVNRGRIRCKELELLQNIMMRPRQKFKNMDEDKGE